MSRLPLVRHEEATNGVAILIKDSSRITNPQQFPLADPDGRLLRVDFDPHGSRHYVINVYAPCQGRHHPAFATRLQAIFPTDGRLVLMGGDFDCIDTQHDAIPAPRPHSGRFVGSSHLATVNNRPTSRTLGATSTPPPASDLRTLRRPAMMHPA